MNKKNIYLSLSLASLAGIFLGLSLSSLRAIAQSPPLPKPQSPPNSISPVKPSQPRQQRSTWETILSILKAKEPRGGSRNSIGSLCLISPGLLEEKNLIWSDRPLFLWMGAVSPLEIRLYSPFNPQQDQTVLWSQGIAATSSTETLQSLPYTGQALQPGQHYDWEVIFNGRSFRYTFEVMPSPERDRLAAALKALEAKHRTEGTTDEAIALEKVNYFAQQDLWSDALQSIFSVKNPSAEMENKVQEIIGYFCQQEKGSAGFQPMTR